jgi:hypothetical protein
MGEVLQDHQQAWNNGPLSNWSSASKEIKELIKQQARCVQYHPTAAKCMNYSSTKEAKMKGVLVIIAVLVFGSAINAYLFQSKNRFDFSHLRDRVTVF